MTRVMFQEIDLEGVGVGDSVSKDVDQQRLKRL